MLHTQSGGELAVDVVKADLELSYHWSVDADDANLS